MAHDVFLSHSTKDKAIADAAVACIESRQIRYWVAPRDIFASSNRSETVGPVSQHDYLDRLIDLYKEGKPYED